ncbi:MAG: peptide chain release factor N(5)-glutamine methyltransferase [Eubacteriales bacterium]|nr:peptide chain release factor N(5)-glutamine methyltransferase [Eubacteriales bacterium]
MTSGNNRLIYHATTCGTLLRVFRGRLTEAGFESARHEAALLISQRTGFSIATLYTYPEKSITAAQHLQLSIDLERRLTHEPIAYILGSTEFFGLPFAVGAGVLIPRGDTERLVETALEHLTTDAYFAESRLDKTPIRILDTCTGSGCVGITIAVELQKKGIACDLYLVELDPIAAGFARKNLDAHGLSEAVLEMADLWPSQQAGGVRRFDMITANPPYIVSQEIPDLMTDVTVFEPHLALDGGADGLSLYRRLIREAPEHLAQPGLLLLEHGYSQAEQIQNLLTSQGYSHYQTINDYGGHPRVTAGWHGVRHVLGVMPHSTRSDAYDIEV